MQLVKNVRMEDAIGWDYEMAHVQGKMGCHEDSLNWNQINVVTMYPVGSGRKKETHFLPPRNSF